MKLEFFEDGLDGGPLILLFGGSCAEIFQLRSHLAALTDGTGRDLAIHELPFVESIDGTALTATVEERESGVVANGPSDFRWILSPLGWVEVSEKLEPFEDWTQGYVSFQYLNSAGGPALIYSTARAW